jgi:hypothetical protein
MLVVTLLFTACSKYDTFESLEVVDNDCGINIKEGSDLAYDKDKGILYIIGDKGDFYICKAEVGTDSITLTYVSSNKIGHNLSSIDSEGLDLDEHGELFLSTEGSTASVYSMNKFGDITGDYGLPFILSDATFASSNSKFEAMTYNKKHGGILLAAELPINGQLDVSKQAVYNLDGDKTWHFKAESYEKNSITAIETIDEDDGNLLVLERALVGSGFNTSFNITLKKVTINGCSSTLNNPCDSIVLESFKAGFSGNYEGLTNIDDGRYLMINDNQGMVTTNFKFFNIKSESR